MSTPAGRPEPQHEAGAGAPQPGPVAARQGWGWRVAVAFDRLANALTGGKDTETISSRIERGCRKGDQCRLCRLTACLLCRLLDRIDPGHCDKSAGI